MGVSKGRLTAISLFSGAGGLDLGLEQAGFEIASSVESDADCVATLKANRGRKVDAVAGTREAFRRTKVIHRRIEKVGLEDLLPSDGTDVDLLAGGPPCQPFSFCGKMKGFDDPRGNLFEQFVRIAKELSPPYILFENVQGLVTAKGPAGVPGEALSIVRGRFEEIGYGTRVGLLNAADYGVPQRRIRFFMIASRHHSLPTLPISTHGKVTHAGTLFGSKLWVSLAEALSSSGPPSPDEVIRPRAELDEKLRALKPGTGLKVAGILEANRPGGHWGYRQDCFLADPSLPSRTIRAASTPDWIYDSGGRLRRLTWRECAILQGFPPEWQFVGARTSKFKQIGNAVPPMLAKSIGVVLADACRLGGVGTVPPASAELPSRFRRAIRYTAAELKVNGESRRVGRRAMLKE